MEERLQKIIARAGIASRRRAEEMMASGLVTVNGRMVTELGSKADVSRDHIKIRDKVRLDGAIVVWREVSRFSDRPHGVSRVRIDPADE